MAQVPLGEREIAILDAQRGVPKQLRDGGNQFFAGIRAQPLLRHAKPEIDDAVVAEQRRATIQVSEDFRDRFGGAWVFRQLLALIDDGPGHRMPEFAFRQSHPDWLAFPGLAQPVEGDKPDLDRQAGPRDAA